MKGVVAEILLLLHFGTTGDKKDGEGVGDIADGVSGLVDADNCSRGVPFRQPTWKILVISSKVMQA